MKWMITLHKGFVKSFLEGEKDIELRTRVPKALRPGDTVLAAQAGAHNKVVLQMSVVEVIKLSPAEMFREHYKGIQLNYLAYEDYTKGKEWVYGIRTYHVEKMEGELHTSDFGVTPFTEEVTVEPAEEEEEPQTATVTKYRHQSLVMSAPKTQNNIIETLLTEKYPSDVEQKLVNDYNAAVAKVLPTSAKEGYLAFLADRKAIKEMVEADCEAAGIPNTL